MLGGHPGQHLCVHGLSEVDYSENPRKLDVPPLILPDDDQIAPIEAAGQRSTEIVRQATLKACKGGSHGMGTTKAEQVNQDLPDFLER